MRGMQGRALLALRPEPVQEKFVCRQHGRGPGGGGPPPARRGQAGGAVHCAQPFRERKVHGVRIRSGPDRGAAAFPGNSAAAGNRRQLWTVCGHADAFQGGRDAAAGAGESPAASLPHPGRRRHAGRIPAAGAGTGTRPGCLPGFPERGGTVGGLGRRGLCGRAQ